MISVPQDGVRTFLPPSHLAMTKPAITRPARHPNYILNRNHGLSKLNWSLAERGLKGDRDEYVAILA